MYQTKQIHYKAIFKQDHDQHKIEYKAKGLFHQDQKTSLDFDTPEGHIQISYDDQEVHLQHGNSLLKFHKEKPLWNQYQLPYGSVALKTKLLKFQNNQDSMKMKYELYDQQGLISTVYIMVTMKAYCLVDEHENI